MTFNMEWLLVLRPAGLSISKIAYLLGFSLTTISRLSEKILSEWQFQGSRFKVQGSFIRYILNYTGYNQ